MKLIPILICALLLFASGYAIGIGSSFGFATDSSSFLPLGVDTLADAPWAFQMQNQQNTGYSPQTIINGTDVGKLSLLWSIDLAGVAGTPVVSNGIVYATGGKSIYAINETTGVQVWRDDQGNKGLAFATRAGVTIDQSDIFAATMNNSLVSLNALTGSVNWVVSVVKGVVGSMVSYNGPQATPLVYQGKIILGETSGDVGARGIVRAFNETDGALLWTFYTVPAAPMTNTDQAFYQNTWGTNGTNGCECGGGAVWNVPAVDPHTGIIYFGTGNPYPNVRKYAIRSPNDTTRNLYSDCVVALNSTNGNLIWYFQEFPHDWGDHDQGMPVQLFNTTINGVETEIVGAAGKAGYYYELNAHTGAMIYKIPVGIHLDSNLTSPGMVYPGGDGGVNTFSSYDPNTNMIYTLAWNSHQNCTGVLLADTMKCVPIQTNLNSTLYGINASTGKIIWNMNMTGYGGGVSSTNNIIFASDGNHNFYALQGSTGKILWQYHDPAGEAGLWNWGPPSVTNGMVFESTLGTSSSGQLIAFDVPSHKNVKFNEFGLAAGTFWNLTFDGVTYTTNSDQITVKNINPSSNTWSISAVPNSTGIRYEPYPSSGEINSGNYEPSYTINFVRQFQVNFGLKPSKSGSTTPVGKGLWFNSSSVLTITATANSGFTFEKWATSTRQIAVANKTDSTTTAAIDAPGNITAIFTSLAT